MGYFIEVLCVIAIGTILFGISRSLITKGHEDNDDLVAGLRLQWVLVFGTPIVLVLVTLWNMAYQVPAGHVGIVYTFGGITGQRGDGLQWTAPWQSITNASVQVQGHKFAGDDKLTAFSSETQEVFVTTTVNVQVSPEHIQELYRDVGPDYFDILVRPRVLQAFKDETVKYTSVEIAPNREAIRRAVRQRLTEELQAHSIIVQDLLLDNISFPPAFQAAIETKQANTQLALAELANVAKKKAEADQAIETARGTGQAILINAEKQAEANRDLAQSITPELIQYIFASKLAPNVSVMMIPSNQQFILGADMLKKP